MQSGYKKCGLILLVLKITAISISSAQSKLWTFDSGHSKDRISIATLNNDSLHSLLAKVSKESAIPSTRPVIEIPSPEGRILKFVIAESPIMNSLSQVSLGINTYILYDTSDYSFHGRIASTPFGVSGMIFTERGSIYISPKSGSNSIGRHEVQYISGKSFDSPISCGVQSLSVSSSTAGKLSGIGCLRRTFRLAIAATGEYTTWAGNQQNAVVYMAITVNNVMAIYERDFNIRFQIVTNNNIIFTDPATDPFPSLNWEGATMNSIQQILDSHVGTANYDLGIVFNRGWNKGYAFLGVVCNPQHKGKSAAGLEWGSGANPIPGPQGWGFDNTVAHEIGHQFGAGHTFGSSAGFCSSNGDIASAFETGSGNTIMSYAGNLSCNTYVFEADDYFHTGTISQILAFLNNSGGCGQYSTTINNKPVISLDSTLYYIPASTNFVLQASGYDEDNNTITYNWEQIDNGFSPVTPQSTNTSGPNFRSFRPSLKGNVRYFPSIENIITNSSSIYEVLPSVSRSMKFRITARDNSAFGPCTTAEDIQVITVGSIGPFKITSQQNNTTWTSFSNENITWNVAGTNQPPVSCDSVRIRLSIDGGLTYPIILIYSTPNDGSEIIVVPNINTSSCKVKVESLKNIFFSINQGFISIQSSCLAEGSIFASDTTLAAQAGSNSLNLQLSPQFGSPLTINGVITNSNPSSVLTVFNTDVASCARYDYNVSRYNSYSFVVSTSGIYTFSIPTPYGLVYSIYKESFVPNSSCINFLASNARSGASGSVIGQSVSAYLIPGQRYVLVVGTWDDNFPYPAIYSVVVAGGLIYSNLPNPGNGYSYNFIAVDKVGRIVRQIGSAVSLTNPNLYPYNTSYDIYGLSLGNTSSGLGMFINQPFDTLLRKLIYDPNYCANFSDNVKTVKILENANLKPHITSVFPQSGAAGTIVTIKGSNFSNVSKVSYGSTSASSFVVNSDSIISSIVGVGSSGSVKVVSGFGEGTFNSFTFIASPSIISALPMIASSNQQVNIFGTNLSGCTAVTFGGVQAASFQVIDDNSISAIVGGGASGPINVTTQTGTASLNGFIFLPITSVYGITNYDNDYTIYPNPTKDYLLVEFQNVIHRLNISVLDLSGRVILKHQEVGAKKVMLNISSIQSGCYLIRIDDLHRRKTYKNRFFKI